MNSTVIATSSAGGSSFCFTPKNGLPDEDKDTDDASESEHHDLASHCEEEEDEEVRMGVRGGVARVMCLDFTWNTASTGLGTSYAGIRRVNMMNSKIGEGVCRRGGGRLQSGEWLDCRQHFHPSLFPLLEHSDEANGDGARCHMLF